MRPSDTVRLCAVISQMCPAQKLDEYTPDAWHPLLAAYPYADCLAAAQGAAATGPFVAVADVVQGVRAIRAERLARTPEPTPLADADDPGAYRAELAARRAAVAAGDNPREVTR
jgi:hypothetical protein